MCTQDLKFLASMPELCDITFLVGDTREPVTGVRAVLAARSRSCVHISHVSLMTVRSDDIMPL